MRTINADVPSNTLVNLEQVFKNYTTLTFNLPDEEEIQMYGTTIEEQDRTQSDLELDLVTTMINLFLLDFPVQDKEIWVQVLSKADSLNVKDVIGLDKFKKFRDKVNTL